jgi:hypothetical protein
MQKNLFQSVKIVLNLKFFHLIFKIRREKIIIFKAQNCEKFYHKKVDNRLLNRNNGIYCQKKNSCHCL